MTIYQHHFVLLIIFVQAVDFVYGPKKTRFLNNYSSLCVLIFPHIAETGVSQRCSVIAHITL